MRIAGKREHTMEIKSCPFCGTIPEVYRKENGLWEVKCWNENCGVIVFTDEKISRRIAIEAWNRRNGE